MKVLMVGLGGIGQRHLRNLHALRGSEIEFIAYRVRRSSQVLSDRLDVEPVGDLEKKYDIQVFTDLQQALQQRPHAAFICNPSSMHMQAALAAAAAGCHLFIEKPLSHQEEGIEELIRLVDQRGLIALVGYQLRFHPFVKRLQELLASQAIGRILAARVEVGEYLPAWHKYEDYRKMYASRADLGGGVILSQIHEFDYLYSFFGMPRRIFALGGHLSSLEIDVEDIASILLEFRADGYRFPVHLHQDYVQRPPSRGCQLVGDAGRILVDFSALRLQLFDREGSVIEDHALENFQRNQLFLEEVAHFLECIEKGTSPIVTLRDGANSLRMALAAKASLQTGEVVYL